MADNTVLINHDGRPQGASENPAVEILFTVCPKCPVCSHVLVAQQGKLQLVGFLESLDAINAIWGYTQDLVAESFELSQVVLEVSRFLGAARGTSRWVEVKNCLFACQILKRGQHTVLIWNREIRRFGPNL